MKILKMIAEWEKGCSCADGSNPEACQECTQGLISAIKSKLKGDCEQLLKAEAFDSYIDAASSSNAGLDMKVGAIVLTSILSAIKVSQIEARGEDDEY